MPARRLRRRRSGQARAARRPGELELLAHGPEPATRPGRFSKRDFQLDLATGTVTCPAGHVAAIPAQPAPSGLRYVSFPTAVCRACSLADRCVASDGRRQIVLERREDLLEAGRQALRDPPRRDYLRRTRPRIERLLGLLTRHYHGRKSRYRGRRKAALQAAWTAVLVNLHPIGAALRLQVP